MLTQRIGFIGAGQMAGALARGMVAADLVAGAQLIASDPQSAATDSFAAGVPGSRIVGSNLEVVDAADVVFLSVKPQHMADVMASVRPRISADKLVISIAAGVQIRALAEGLGTKRIVRVMPNTPSLVGQSATGFCLGEGAGDDDRQLVEMLFESVGLVVCLEERLLDAVTGLSGSGPAFVYVMIEALSDGGVRMGLPRGVATALAAQTVRGAAEMVIATGEHPAVLKDRVASPGGTTIAGLKALEDGGIRATLVSAVEAATRRSAELGETN